MFSQPWSLCFLIFFCDFFPLKRIVVGFRRFCSCRHLLSQRQGPELTFPKGWLRADCTLKQVKAHYGLESLLSSLVQAN
ncbi:uncharacterized protein BDZ83DRAFT_399292 [Colletotrichum acutatum]|uniref:Secreted protein n=1 Tax=Glomerella acutata TaxID=27357 RepID=A0AAD9D166_GLOAC|nr:uncharacterized protein BDZ83DRAFT_399292 [Colletotrichum acutatum]KAK1730252.1 hypothetical protein BDZ83DRAFT_399292 [Colletotrichum acutatum]